MSEADCFLESWPARTFGQWGRDGQPGWTSEHAWIHPCVSLHVAINILVCL